MYTKYPEEIVGDETGASNDRGKGVKSNPIPIQNRIKPSRAILNYCDATSIRDSPNLKYAHLKATAMARVDRHGWWVVKGTRRESKENH